MRAKLIVALSLAAFGCDAQLYESCVPGTIIACACSDGQMSKQVCLSPDRFGLCSCGGDSSDLSIPDVNAKSDLSVLIQPGGKAAPAEEGVR